MSDEPVHCPQFIRAIQGLGSTNKERAAVLGINIRLLYRLKKGDIPTNWRWLIKHEHLWAALVSDLKAEVGSCQCKVSATKETPPTRTRRPRRPRTISGA